MGLPQLAPNRRFFFVFAVILGQVAGGIEGPHPLHLQYYGIFAVDIALAADPFLYLWLYLHPVTLA